MVACGIDYVAEEEILEGVQKHGENETYAFGDIMPSFVIMTPPM